MYNRRFDAIFSNPVYPVYPVYPIYPILGVAQEVKGQIDRQYRRFEAFFFKSSIGSSIFNVFVPFSLKKQTFSYLFWKKVANCMGGVEKVKKRLRI